MYNGQIDLYKSQLQTGDSTTTGAEEDVGSAKLNNVEAQRVMAVISEMQKKVQLIGLLPDVVDRRVSSVFGPESMATIQVRFRSFSPHGCINLNQLSQ